MEVRRVLTARHKMAAAKARPRVAGRRPPGTPHKRTPRHALAVQLKHVAVDRATKAPVILWRAARVRSFFGSTRRHFCSSLGVSAVDSVLLPKIQSMSV